MDERDFVPVRIAVMTVSDTRSAADDRSGDTLVERLTGAGHTLAARTILPDDRHSIADQLFAEALVLLVVAGEDIAPGQLAAFHAGVTGQVVDLGAFAVDFVRAAPGGHGFLQKRGGF